MDEAEKLYREKVNEGLEKLKEEATRLEIEAAEQWANNQKECDAMNKLMIAGTVSSMTCLSTNLPVVTSLLVRYPRAVPAFAVLGVFFGSTTLTMKCRVHLNDGVVTLRDNFHRRALKFAEVREDATHLLWRAPVLSCDDLNKSYTSLSRVHREARYN